MNRYKARQTGIKLLKGAGKAVVEGVATTVDGLRHVHKQGKINKYK